jgi:predicted short-subunit dehydrogenase-like oxidoreductase (DUF2520 family)
MDSNSYFSRMINVVLLGAGNVANHLIQAFSNTENVNVIQVYNRSKAALKPFEKLTETTTSIEDLIEADVYLISVKDDAVEEVVSILKNKNALIAHTSGSVPMFSSATRNGVFYPLQTFSKNTKVNFKEIPICLEASAKKDLILLEELAGSISEKIFTISSEQRKKLHLAAVFACNFTNHLYAIAEEICQQNQVPFEVLNSLIKETAQKATLHSPREVQTGPAIRNDQKTIRQHLEQITNADEAKIYKLLTQSIINYHGKKL